MTYTAGWNAARGGGSRWKGFSIVSRPGDSVLEISPEIRSFSSTAIVVLQIGDLKRGAAVEELKAGV